MNVEQLVLRIEQKDWTVLNERGQFAEADIRPLSELARHEEVEIRELALYVLDMMTGPAANAVLLERLRDANEMIRFRACDLLSKRAERPSLTSLLEELKSNSDGDIRSRIARLLGERGNGATLVQLGNLLNRDPDVSVRHSIRLAMARLGDRAQFPALAQAFKTDDPTLRVQALADLEYTRSRDLVKDLAFMLDDSRNVLNIGLSHSPEYVRVCDVAVNTFDRVLGHPFKFAVEKIPRRYLPIEIDDARKVVS